MPPRPPRSSSYPMSVDDKEELAREYSEFGYRETDDLDEADRRNYYKVERWDAAEQHVFQLLHASNDLSRAQAIFASEINRRPRGRYTLRQGIPRAAALAAASEVAGGYARTVTGGGWGDRLAGVCMRQPRNEKARRPKAAEVFSMRLAISRLGCLGGLSRVFTALSMLDPFEVTIDDHEISAHTAEWARAPLFPISDLIDSKSECGCKVILRQADLCSYRTYIEFRRNMELCRLLFPFAMAKASVRPSAILSNAFLLIVVTRLSVEPLWLASHCFSSEISFVIPCSRFLSPLDRFAFSPFPNTVIKKDRHHIPRVKRDCSIPAGLSLAAAAKSKLATTACARPSSPAIGLAAR